jgi:hypothetical protein
VGPHAVARRRRPRASRWRRTCATTERP